MDVYLDRIFRWLILYRVVVFSVLGLGILIYLRKFVWSLREWRLSVFGLERKIAQRKVVSASTGLILLMLLVIGEFLLVTVLQPQLPAQNMRATPTIDPFVTPTLTLSVPESGAQQEPTPTIGQDMLESNCEEGVLEITSPEEGEQVNGTVELIGTVNVEDFGSYKYEYSTTGAVNWVTIAAGNQLKLDESLGFWYTSSLVPGSYLLQLVPLNNIGEALTPCITQVEVVSEE